jgi:hypothetical protein
MKHGFSGGYLEFRTKVYNRAGDSPGTGERQFEKIDVENLMNGVQMLWTHGLAIYHIRITFSQKI